MMIILHNILLIICLVYVICIFLDKFYENIAADTARTERNDKYDSAVSIEYSKRRRLEREIERIDLEVHKLQEEYLKDNE